MRRRARQRGSSNPWFAASLLFTAALLAVAIIMLQMLIPNTYVPKQYQGLISLALGGLLDANEWDYIDSTTTSDGRTFDSTALDAMPAVDRSEPSGEIAWIRYGIPGYRRFRCKACGTRLTKPKGGSMRPPFLCLACQAKS